MNVKKKNHNNAVKERIPASSIQFNTLFFLIRMCDFPAQAE